MTVLFSSCDGAEPLARLGLRIGAADVGGSGREEKDPEDWLCVNGERVARFKLLLYG
jgi:hypothetical protein